MGARVFCEITDQPIDLAACLARVNGPVNGIDGAGATNPHGAQVFFLGNVRASNLGRDVLAVEYDAAPALAEAVLREIVAEAAARWGADLRACVVHRVGRLGVGECSVAIIVSTRHRDEAYQASRHIIEQLKVRAPIWKREFYSDGETEWLKGHALCSHGDAHAHAQPGA